ncbi:MAG: hypothetical protein AAF316_16330, partial [Cyanobacteria bacterium P01_A01_bin.80]
IENQDPNTLLLTAADSNAGNLQIDDKTGDTVGTVGVNPTLKLVNKTEAKRKLCTSDLSTT